MSTGRISNVKNISFSYGSPDLTIGWDGFGDKYILRYRAIDGDWVDYITLFAPAYVISGLTEGKLYEFEMVSANADFKTTKAYFSFTIPSGAVGPSNLRFLNVSLSYVVLAWDGPAGDYGIAARMGDERKPVDFISFTKATDDNPASLLIKDLDTSKNYKFYVSRYVLNERIGAEANLYIEKPAGDFCGDLCETTIPPASTTTTTTTTTTIPALP